MTFGVEAFFFILSSLGFMEGDIRANLGNAITLACWTANADNVIDQLWQQPAASVINFQKYFYWLL